MKPEKIKEWFEKEYFLLLLPVYFFFHGFVENHESVSLAGIIRLTVQYLMAAGVLSVIFFFLFRSWRKTALYVFVLMAFNFFFGFIHDRAKLFLPHSFLIKYTFLLPFVFVLFISCTLFFYKTGKRFNKLVLFLNFLLLLFIFMDIPALYKSISKANRQVALANAFLPCSNCSKPDVYLIVSDEYAGSRELSEIFHFDNSPFEKFLQSKGFHIIKNSRSNYNYTDFSVASMLSMNFLSDIEGSNSSKHDLNICYGLINKNPLWNFFKANGYEIKNYSVFNVDNIPAKVQQNQILMGSRMITSQTFLSRVDRDIGFNLVTKLKMRSAVNEAQNHVKESNEKLYNDLLKESQVETKKPRFVFTHLMMPHFPYYFNRNGKEYPAEFVMQPNHFRKKEYIEYLQYCNKKFVVLLNTLMANLKKPSIIIFMGDHGWRHFTGKADRQYYFMNLSSVYLPDKNYLPFYDGMSNVNMFRILLNTEFRQRLPLLKDSVSFLKE